MMGRMVGMVIDFMGGIWVLIHLGVVSRFKVSGRYWRWRTSTAFPGGTGGVGRGKLCKLGFEYAQWAWRMRRLR